MKILVIDDEQDVVNLFVDILKKKNYQVEGVLSGKAALDVIDKNKPDIILLDIKMPDMDGIQTLEEIKKKDPAIEVVMLTAYGYNEKLINESMEKGASGYISKNLPLQQIINNFGTLLKSMSLKKKE